MRKIATNPEDDYKTGRLTHHPFQRDYKLVTIDLSKQQASDADSKRIQ